MPPITTLIGMSDDENVINSSVYLEQLPSSWQTESQVQTRLETVLGANTIKCIELPRNDHGRVRGWCFIQFTSKALADQFISIAMTQSTLEQVADTIESSKTEANQQDSDDNDCSALHNELKDTRLMSLNEWQQLRDEYIAYQNKLRQGRIGSSSRNDDYKGATMATTTSTSTQVDESINEASSTSNMPTHHHQHHDNDNDNDTVTITEESIVDRVKEKKLAKKRRKPTKRDHVRFSSDNEE